MKRINTPITTRLVSGSYISLSVAGVLLFALLLALSVMLFSKPTNPDEMVSLWVVVGGVVLFSIAYFTYVFLRTGIFTDGEMFVERRVFKTYRLNMRDIKQVDVSSYANSSAAGNVVTLITDLANPSGFSIRHLSLMSSKKRSWAVGEQIVSAISQHNPQLLVTSPSTGRHSLWQGFDNYIASKNLAKKAHLSSADKPQSD